jgi:iron complex outermembrane receptor protein
MKAFEAVVCLALALPWAATAQEQQAQEKVQQEQGSREGAQQAEAAAPRAEEGARREVSESLTVTATRAPRRSRDVPQAIAVVGKEQLEDKVVFNVKDVVAGTPGVLIESKNGGYDSRLLIRGAGLKAAYGVREIMILRDGVPLTDPDSLSRLDFVDTQDVERIEISKGPGNLFSPGSAGGAVQIISRSVFDPGGDLATAGYGASGAANAHLRASTSMGSHAAAFTASWRHQENDWRSWNRFDSLQAGLKHGVHLGGGTLESEVAWTQADMQLPGSMNQALFDAYRQSGKQTGTADAWRHSGRYSRILFVNTRLEQALGDLSLRPRLYYNQWRHLHPVTGAINESGDWTKTLGTDLEAQHRHELWGLRGSLVGGLTAKAQWNDDSRKYQYRDVTLAGGRITATLSDEKGALMERQVQRNLLAGFFLQETLQPTDRVTLDLGLRLDRSWLQVGKDELTRYDWASGRYLAGSGYLLTRKTFDLPAPKAGLSVRVTEAVSAYASAARASQVPSESEVLTNPALSAARSTSYELGVKARGAAFSLDGAVYWNRVTGEIVSTLDQGVTTYSNAGETDKRGLELSGSARVGWGLELGASYAHARYRYVRFDELVRGVALDRSGKALPFVPTHQWGLFAAWRHESGLRLRVQSSTWGSYWLDSANTARYGGYSFLTSAGAAWARGRHELLLDVQNLLDLRYAAQATRDTSGRDSYSAGAPRSVMLAYRFHLRERP